MSFDLSKETSNFNDLTLNWERNSQPPIVRVDFRRRKAETADTKLILQINFNGGRVLPETSAEGLYSKSLESRPTDSNALNEER